MLLDCCNTVHATFVLWFCLAPLNVGRFDVMGWDELG